MEISGESIFHKGSSRSIHLADDDYGEGQNNSFNRRTNDENVDPSSFPLTSESPLRMRTKLKDRRSLMKKQASSRRRRRSSARFLRITPDDEDNTNEMKRGQYDASSFTSLGEVYRNAIRMNAENRINASNSWNLNLIDHLDRFIAPELRSDIGGESVGRRSQVMNPGSANDTVKTTTNPLGSTIDSTMISGVNFTKASCTLDASVKIYSYRVDDVHLTSYKVLANLNRTDTGTQSNNKSKNVSVSDTVYNDPNVGNDDGELSSRSKMPHRKTNAAETLEQNVANINIHKLDAAFDIDPLFHKMSKTFDEGGAKGLLLANLGVSNSGCKIVFDSTLDTEETPAPLISKECLTDQDQDPGIQDEILAPKPTVDVSGLVGKLENLLSSAYGSYSKMENIPLVPQLASLRNQYAELREGGFIETGVVFSDRYASSTEEEAEADKSIHLEAIERSQASQADLGRSRISRESTETYGAVEDNDHYTNSFGYGCDDDNLFEDLHDDDHRYSSSSFQGARASTGDVAANEGSKLSRPTFSQASLLLDAIASGDISTTQPGNHYEFFNTQALESLSTGNWWAGAGHWKKIPSKRRYKSSPGIIGGNSSNSSGGIEKNARLDLKKRRGRNTKTKSLLSPGSKMLVSISESTKSLEDLLERSKCKHLKNTTNSFQLTKAMQTKYGKADNLLPVDAGLGIKELGTLFLRPKIGLTDMVKAKQEVEDTMEAVSRTRAVGFGGTETWGVDDDSLYGASDDGVGFDVVDTDTGKDEVHDKNEFVIPDLEDIRKVNRIKIGYATMARKVDVKRLKKDLWTELEQTFVSKTQDDIERNKNSGDLSIKKTASDEKFRGSNSYDEFDDDIRSNAKIQPTNIAQSLSFQDTVRDMQANQSQPDVTLPFYFICILHLCNEKGLSLESSGLEDFVIHSA